MNVPHEMSRARLGLPEIGARRMAEAFRVTANPLKRRAHSILDDIRAGMHHPGEAVNWALRVLGEPVGK